MVHLISLVAAISLLVWGTYTVRRGVLHVFGADLRSILEHGVGNRVKAFFAGLGVTTFLQSATATALLTSSFQAKGLLGTSSAVALMLGADVGSAVMVQVFSLDLSWLSPLLVASGIILFMNNKQSRAGQVGETILGLGLMILALQLIIQATGPMKTSEAVRAVFSALEGDSLLCVVAGVALAQACYSSLAVVVLTGTLVTGSVLSLSTALAVVLGANLGSALLAVISTAKGGNLARRAPLGNLIFKAVGVGFALVAFPIIDALAKTVSASPQTVAVGFHLVFNLGLAAVCLPLTGLAARRIDAWLPLAETAEPSGARPKYLDQTALSTPDVSIGCAARESVRIASMVQDMLEGTMRVLRDDDARLARELVSLGHDIDRVYSATKLYLADISRGRMTSDENTRWSDTLSFATSMEQAGDILEHMLAGIVERKIATGKKFSPEGLSDLLELHNRVLRELEEAMTVYMGGSLQEAKRLAAMKTAYRELDHASNARHMARLSAKTPESIETSSLHQDILADLKRVSSLACSTAFPILHRCGVIREETSLVEEADLALAFERANELLGGSTETHLQRS